MESLIFRPQRRIGLLYHFGLIAIGCGLVIFGLQTASDSPIGMAFLLALLPALVGSVLLPLLIYRAYALWSAAYIIERDGIRLQWGLRVEEIPMDSIQWVHPDHSLDYSLPLPWPRLEGAVLGTRHLRSGQTLEYLAARTNGLILLATPKRIFVISPRNPDDFLRAYRSQTELGSFTSRPARSVQPTAIFSNIWPDPWARVLVVGIFLVNLALLIWTSLIIPEHPNISFRFDTTGAPLEFAPGARLILLPVISILMGTVDFLLGLFYYRRNVTQIAAYMLWITGLIAGGLFGGAIFFMLRTG